VRFDDAEQDLAAGAPDSSTTAVPTPTEEGGNRKSYGNQPLLRIIGRSMGMEQTRLLSGAKTWETLKKRTLGLETVYRELNKKQPTREVHLYPNT
jgi:hypothetical protein